MTDVRSLSDSDLRRMLAESEPAASSARPLSALSDDELRAALTATPATAPAEGAGLAMNATAGINSAIYNTVGAPVDAARWVLNKGAQGINALAGSDVLGQIPSNSFGGSQSLANMFSTVGVARPEDVQAVTPEERIARGVGEGVGYTVAPQAAVGGLMRLGTSAIAPRTMDALGRLTGQTASAATTVGNAFAGGAAGAGATAAMEAAPEQWRGAAGLAGGLAGAGVGSLVAGVPSLARAGGRAAGEFFDPYTVAGQQRAAARELQDAATDPSAARQALDTMPDPLVPGSRPTTFQATGDMGLGALERRVMTQNPDAFMARRAEQNTARLSALGEIQPSGAPEAVSRVFRDRLSALDTQTEEAVMAATEAARGRAQALGGNQSAEAYGDAMRGSLAEAREAAKVNERALWAAVDPENRLDVPFANTSEAAKRISLGMPRLAGPMSADEALIFAQARVLPPQARLNEVSAFRSRISDAMMNERRQNGQSAAYARLSQLRSAVQDDLEGVIARRVAEDERAVAAGVMSEEQTVAANIRRQIEAWEAGRVGAEAARANLGGGSRSTVAAGPGRVPSAYGAPGQGERGFSVPPGREGLSGDAGGAPGLPFDDAARERLRAATQATRERAQTFDRGVNGQLLRRPMASGPYDVGPSSVPARLFSTAPGSADRIAQFRQAVGDGEAMAQMQDYAAMQLRRSAERADGTLDPAKVAAWRRNHAEALRAFPKLDARFADAARASEATAEATAARRLQLDDYQKGMVGRLIGIDNPADVTRAVGGIFSRQDAATTMRGLAQAVRNEPAAREGLRKAVADHIASRFIGNTEAATTGQGGIKADAFQTFVRQNRAALGQVFSDAEIEMLDRIAVDIQRSSRSLNAVRIPGQSNTAQDTFALGATDNRATILGKLVASSVAAGGSATLTMGPAAGVAAAFGAPAAAALRQFGITRVDDLIRDAMLDPDLAKRLLSAAGNGPDVSLGWQLVGRYRASAGAGVATSVDRAPDHPNITIRPRASLAPSPLSMPQPAASAEPKTARDRIVEHLVKQRQGAQPPATPSSASPAVRAVVEALMSRGGGGVEARSLQPRSF